MVPTHATKAGIRYRYYVSTPCLHGEAKTASAGSSPAFPPQRSKKTIVKALQERLTLPLGDRGAVADLVAGIVVHRDSLVVRLKSDTRTKHPIPRMISRS